MIDFGKSMGRRQRRRRHLQQSSHQQSARRADRQPTALPPASGTDLTAGQAAKVRLTSRALPPARSRSNNSALVPRPVASPLVRPLLRNSESQSSDLSGSLTYGSHLGDRAAQRPQPQLRLAGDRSPLGEPRRSLSTGLPANSSPRRRRRQAKTQQAAVKLQALHTQQRPASHSTRNSQRSPLPRAISPLLYGTRLLIVGVGIGVIAGTLLSTWNPASRVNAGASQTAISVKSPNPSQQAAAPNFTPPPMPLKLGAELTPLKTQIRGLATQNSTLAPGIFLIDLDTNNYVDFSGTATFPAASTIKVPILVAFFQDVDAGKIRLDEQLVMRPEIIGSGSGDMQYQPPGTKFSALETAFKMIAISDNTATNMLIARLGGAAALNQRFQSWGLTATVIRNPLPDLQGTNTTSPRDLANLMAWVNQGDLVSMRSRDRLLDIMRQTVNDSLLPQGLGEGATIAHKTGDIGSLIGDVGLVDMPNGKRYVIAALVKRPFNDMQAPALINQISQITYRALSQPTTVNSPMPGSAARSNPNMRAPNPTAPNNFTNFSGQGQAAPTSPGRFNQQ